MFTLPYFVKTACAAALAVVMTLNLPSVVRFVFRRPAPPAEMQLSMPERVATNEQKIADLGRRMDLREKDGERLATIEEQTRLILVLLAPAALFIFTHTWEIWARRRRESARLSGELLRHLDERGRGVGTDAG